MSERQIAAGLGLSATAAGEGIRRARPIGVTWPLPEGLTDEALELRLYQPAAATARERRAATVLGGGAPRAAPVRVTLQLLWEEHRAVHPDYGYSRYCELYRAWGRCCRRRCDRSTSPASALARAKCPSMRRLKE